MADVLRSTPLPVRTDPLEAPTPQTVVPWAEVLAFVHSLEVLAAARTAFQLVETPGQVACVVAEGPVASAKEVRPRRAAAKT